MVRPKRPFLAAASYTRALSNPGKATAGGGERLGLSCGGEPYWRSPHDPTLSRWTSRGPVDKRRAPAKYAESVAMPVNSIEELQERVDKYARPRSTDDVSITSDGTRLDSKEKVLAFLEELARERAAHTPEG